MPMSRGTVPFLRIITRDAVPRSGAARVVPLLYLDLALVAQAVPAVLVLTRLQQPLRVVLVGLVARVALVCMLLMVVLVAQAVPARLAVVLAVLVVLVLTS